MTTSEQPSPAGQAPPLGTLMFRTTEFEPPDYSVVIRCGPRWQPAYPGQYRDGVWLFTVPLSADGSGPMFRFIILDSAGHVRMISERLRVRAFPDDGALFVEGRVRLRRISRPLRAVAAGMDRHRTSAAWIYALAALVLVIAAVLFSWRAYQDQSLLRAALALILLGIATALAYEADALRQRRADPSDPDPTIARVAGLAFLQHPAAWWGIFVVIMGLAGALIIHFTSSNGAHPWVLGFAIAAYLVGGLVAAAVAARFHLWFLA